MKIKSLCVVALLCCSIGYGSANTILNDSGTGSVTASSNFHTQGFDFTVGSTPLLVTALGLWDENLDGFGSSHVVGLWDNSGNLLGSVAIPSGTVATLSGEFRYITLASPVTLSAGTTYVLGATFSETDLDRYKVNDSTTQATFDPAVTSGNQRGVENEFFPSGVGAPGSAVGPNAQFTVLGNHFAVPELGPGMFLVALVFGGLIFLHRGTAISTF